MIELYAVTQEQYDAVLALIDSATTFVDYDQNVLDIISEEAHPEPRQPVYSGAEINQNPRGLDRPRGFCVLKSSAPKPPLAAPCAVRGGGIFEENDGGDVLQGSEYSEICDVESPQALRASSPLFKGEPWVPRVSFWRPLIQNSGK